MTKRDRERGRDKERKVAKVRRRRERCWSVQTE